MAHLGPILGSGRESALARGGRSFLTDTGITGAVGQQGSAILPPREPPPQQAAAASNDEGLDALKATAATAGDETQATALLKKRKDMRMVEDALEAVKREFRARMERLSERQLRFEEKQRALQDMIAKFKSFIEEVCGCGRGSLP